MSNDKPKLYTQKPKKTKRFPSETPTVSQSATVGSTPIPSTKSSSSTITTGSSTPTKAPLLQRFRVPFGALLAINFAVLSYVLFRTRASEGTDGKGEDDVEIKPEYRTEENEVADVNAEGEIETEGKALPNLPSPTLTANAKVLPLVSSQDQLEILKWMLEEKRKIKPVNAEEKASIDKEKAMLKHYINSKTPPSF